MPKLINLFKMISLSIRKTAWRVEKTDNINSLFFFLKATFLNSILGSWQIDRCYYWYCLAVFYLRSQCHGEETEELVSKNSLHGTTTDKNIFKEVEKALIYYNLKWNLLRCATTDSDKNTCGAEKGLEKFTNFTFWIY